MSSIRIPKNSIAQGSATVPSGSDDPLIPDIGVIALVPDMWGSQWQPRHHVMTRLARYFQIVWMDPPRHWNTQFRRHQNEKEKSSQYVPRHSFAVYDSGIWNASFYRFQLLDSLLMRIRLRQAAAILRRRSCKRIVLYIWRPELQKALGLIPHDLTCYHIDDEYSFSPVELPLDPCEVQLLRSVDQVFIHSPALMAKKGGFNPNTILVTNGVDYDAHSAPVPEPADLAAIPHPRIGYSGWIKKQINWQLILGMARRHPEWSFVFVGGMSPHATIAKIIQELGSFANVYFLGSKSSVQIAQYPQHFDVCIMPYNVDDYTKYIYPMKLHEYLAGGRPAIGSPIRSLEPFSGVVAIARSLDEWSAAITDALLPDANTEERRSYRQSVARKHDWEVVVFDIARTIALRLEPAAASRLESHGASLESLR